jgi:hypothetical protein
MARILIWTLPILLFFRVEVIHFFVNLNFIQWILLLLVFSTCLFFYKRKLKYSVLLFFRKVKYFDLKKTRIKISNLKKTRIKISKWANNNSAEAIGKSLVSQLERNIFIKLGCIALSTAVLSHYPSLLTKPTPAIIFLLTMTAYSFMGLAFRKEMLIFMISMYSLMAVMPYAMAFLSHDTGINLFESLPADVVSLLNINIFNLTQTANKLFIFTAPWLTLIVLVFILSSVIIRVSLKLVFTVFLKVLQALNPVQ